MKSAPGLLLCICIPWLLACSSFEPLPSRDCRTVTGIPGPEDFALDTASAGGTSRLLVSSQARRDGASFKEPGAMFAVPVLADGLGTPQKLPLVNRPNVPFHPHGVSLTQAGEKKLLYVINHASPTKHLIEIFRVEPERLVFEKSLSHELLLSPNDLTALPDGQIYVSNDHGYRGFLRFVEDLFAAGWSDVVHYRAGKWTRVAGGIGFANGVEVSPGGDRLFVAATRDRGIYVYGRNPKTGAVAEDAVFWKLPTGADNLMWENPTTLIVAGHPSIFAFLSHAGDANDRSPSEAYRVDITTGRATRIFGDDGKIMDASATALVYKGRLIISGVFDPELVSCRAP